ncbi:unnamed protein product [Closterium sp. Naga37s-1]|nr:unnamed protein product [Closterium sp. Naga37s-1]
MAGFEDFCASLGLSVGIGKFLVCYLISIPCCFLQRLLPAGTVRHIWATLSGLVLTYIAFGYESLGHCVVACVVAYGSMLVYRKKCGVITFFTTFIYLIGCSFPVRIPASIPRIAVRAGAMMILVLKVTSVAYDYQDGGKPRKPDDAKTAAISDAPKPIAAMPSLLQFLGYTFCCGLHFAGPFYDFSAYNDWIDRKGVSAVLFPFQNPQPFSASSPISPLSFPLRQIWAPGTRTAPALVPFLRAFVQGIVAAVIQLKLASILDIDILKTPKVYFAMPYWRRFLFIYHACEVTRWKYYFIWSISESAMIAAGLGFSGWVRKMGKGDEGGKQNGGKVEGEGKEKHVGGSFTEVASWKRAQNCHILGVELATSTATLATNWNISVGLWLRTCESNEASGCAAVSPPARVLELLLPAYLYSPCPLPGRDLFLSFLVLAHCLSWPNPPLILSPPSSSPCLPTPPPLPPPPPHSRTSPPSPPRFTFSSLACARRCGLYPGYLLFFVGVALEIAGSRVIYKYERAIPPQATFLKGLATVLHAIYACFCNNYVAIGFIVLTAQETITAYKGLLYLGNIVPLAIVILGNFLPSPRPSRRAKTE